MTTSYDKTRYATLLTILYLIYTFLLYPTSCFSQSLSDFDLDEVTLEKFESQAKQCSEWTKEQANSFIKSLDTEMTRIRPKRTAADMTIIGKINTYAYNVVVSGFNIPLREPINAILETTETTFRSSSSAYMWVIIADKTEVTLANGFSEKRLILREIPKVELARWNDIDRRYSSLKIRVKNVCTKK